MGPKTRKELKSYIEADLTYLEEKATLKLFFLRYLFEAGFKYIYWLRKTRYHYLLGKGHKLRFVWCRFWLKHYGYKYSFDISYRAQIGKGLRISHYGYIVVPSNTHIGEFCNLKPGVVIGLKYTGTQSKGHTIGNNVDFGVGSKIIGDSIVLGDNISIGANAVVTKSFPSNVVLVGVPAKNIGRRE